MANWFRKRIAAHPHPSTDVGPTDHALKDAYERGRREERARHRRSPMIAMALVAVALVGGASLVLAVKEGSFQDGGAVMDRSVSTAAREAGPTLKKATDEAGEGLRKVQDKLSSDPPAADTPSGDAPG
jgi:hypothetical protein